MSANPTPLELTPAARAAVGRAALDWCLEYFDTMHALPVYPSSQANDLQALLREVTGATRALRQVLDLLQRQPDVLVRGRRDGPPP